MASFKDELRSHLKVAEARAELSYARRLKVGSVIVRDGRTISEGRNGMPPGGSNVCEDIINGKLVTKPGLIHAEANAILWAASEGTSTEGCIIVTTDSPCFECAKMILGAKIKAVYYRDEYRITDSLNFLRENNVLVEKIDI